MLRSFLLATFTILLLQTSHIAHADTLLLPDHATQNDLRTDVTQPYIVKQGDTLWDIANHFFKDPQKWLKVWEQNLYITNPDLIYPGNKIWFKAKSQTQVQPTPVAQTKPPVSRPQPHVVNKPVERMNEQLDTSIALNTLARQDFISPRDEKGVGYVLDAKDERLNFGIHDFIYLNIKYPTHINDFFDIFRAGDKIKDPKTDKTVGILMNHLGKVQILSEEHGIYRGIVVEASREIMRGDRIRPFKPLNARLQPIYPTQRVKGKVLYIQNNGTEAGQNQAIGIDLGLKHGMRNGMMLAVHRPGRKIQDTTQEKNLVLPEEHIATIIILKAQRDASLALITYSTDSVHIGDIIRNLSNH